MTTANDNREAKSNSGASKIAIVLVVAGLVVLVIHYLLLQQHQIHGDESWAISLEANLTAENTDTVINIQPPYESENHRIIRRSISHAGLRIVPVSKSDIEKRSIRLRPSSPGKYQVKIEFVLQFSKVPRFYSAASKALSTKNRQYFLSDNDLLQLDDPAIEAVLSDMEQIKAGQEKLPEQIFQFTQKFANRHSSELRNAPTILASRVASHHERALLMTALCRKAGLPARVVTGLELKDDPIASLEYWVEVNIKDRWVIYHPGLGYRENLPVNYVALDKIGNGIVSAHVKNEAVHALDNEIMIERMPESMSSPDNSRHEWYQVFIFDRLSSEAREQLALLMLLPLGALLTCLIRQVGGVRSYGVFTPTILALAMTYADLQTTILILSIILSLVYFGRPAFNSKLSRTPRLSIIFTLVAVSMVVGVSILDYFSLASDGHLILLPIVILTSLIDRFFSTVESNGYRTSFVRLLWTFIITLMILPILSLHWLGAWILRYPELHFFTLAAFVLISAHSFKQKNLPKWLVQFLVR